MRPFLFVAIALSATGIVTTGTTAEPPACLDCLVSRYWAIDPQLYKSKAFAEFPETEALAKLRTTNLGIAFSGGGTRSAAATLGQLRGLQTSGWLDKVRYVAAVSGGSWSAVPFVYSPFDLEDLLGAPEGPHDITLESLDKKTEARGRLGKAIAKSSLLPGAALEAGDIISRNRLEGEYQKIAGAAFARLKGPDAARADKTYARLLDRIFISPLISKPLAQGGSAPRYFSWTDDSVADIATISQEVRGAAPINPVAFARAHAERPFLIALGTMVIKDANAGYPQLVPVEYTPLYVGVRQRYGDAVGGTYVSPFAYDATQAMVERADPDTKGMTGVVGVGPAKSMSTFSLADVVASSGAAPQLHLLVDAIAGKVDPQLRRVAEFFPTFRNIAVRPGDKTTAGATDAMPHGDGGFIDNLGLLPLLARHVENIIVFVNAPLSHRLETQLASYFWATGMPDGNGSRRINTVFESKHWKELLQGLDAARDSGGPEVYCSDPKDPWKVSGNEYYNVQPFDKGVNICWVYLADPDTPLDRKGASEWRKALRPEVRVAMFPDKENKQVKEKGKYEKDFRRFPWFRTFGEDLPKAVDLRPRQVNVLANFTSWVVTHPATQEKFRTTFGITPEVRR